VENGGAIKLEYVKLEELAEAEGEEASFLYDSQINKFKNHLYQKNL
jgi:hypothetical protein